MDWADVVPVIFLAIGMGLFFMIFWLN